ncbi:hypothetical protein MLD38_006221 [Melastoma candidum]|uniref:Uncharacterized protein n=1 Tax=Melastoma candidum TaxID=119954 RepID=A0ACB9RVN0_9MYRT|nr:hypothetical protein MLD38_006221 [Melastoma candidum]
MPGTIQISVLEIRDLPSSSSLNSVSIRVAMGKREYQIADSGDFSIPLTTLRENMIVKVFDANGAEICRTGIDTKMVVEKGLWNDRFPLEGGGEMLLKLQFVLSEEEKNRIRMMRLSALAKKDAELVSKSTTLSEKATSSSLRYDEGSEQKKVEPTNQRVLSQDEAATMSSPHHASRVKSRTDELTPLNQDSTTGCSDGSKDPPWLSSLSSVATAPLTETGLTKSAKTSKLEGTSSSSPPKLKGGVWDLQHLPKRAPSSIRTMISVFESGRVPESRTSLKLGKKNGSRTEGAISNTPREESQLLTRREIKERFRQTMVLDDPNSSSSSAEITATNDNNSSDIQREKNRIQIAYWKNFRRNEVTPGIWIFPDDPRSTCITTGGKHAVRVVECCMETVSASPTEHSEEGTMPSELEHDVKEHKRVDASEANLWSSTGGPSGQAMRIAVMVGFGVLVLFTRQRQDK